MPGLDYSGLEQCIEYYFSDKVLLSRALTHRSYSPDSDIHLERLEFLGDAVLGAVVAEYLHDQFPDDQEGQLSRMRAALVRKERLLDIGKKWQLQKLIRVGEGERAPQGGKAPSIVANAVEAVIGAVFADAGWAAAKQLVLLAWKDLLAQADKLEARDAKSALQEWTQGHQLGLPQYQVEDQGVSAVPRFVARCYVEGEWMGSGHGERKKMAELAAALNALSALQAGEDE